MLKGFVDVKFKSYKIISLEIECLGNEYWELFRTKGN